MLFRSCQDYLPQVFHDPSVTSWVDVLKHDQSLKEFAPSEPSGDDDPNFNPETFYDIPKLKSVARRLALRSVNFGWYDLQLKQLIRYMSEPYIVTVNDLEEMFPTAPEIVYYIERNIIKAWPSNDPPYIIKNPNYKPRQPRQPGPPSAGVAEGRVIPGNFPIQQRQAAAAQSQKDWDEYQKHQVALEDKLKKLAAWWWNNDENPTIEKKLAAMGLEIGQDEGYDGGGVFIMASGDVNGDSYMSWPAEELEQLKEATVKPVVPTVPIQPTEIQPKQTTYVAQIGRAHV